MHVGIAYLRWRGKRSRHSRRMRTRDFAYLARGPWRYEPCYLGYYIKVFELRKYLQISHRSSNVYDIPWRVMCASLSFYKKIAIYMYTISVRSVIIICHCEEQTWGSMVWDIWALLYGTAFLVLISIQTSASFFSLEVVKQQNVITYFNRNHVPPVLLMYNYWECHGLSIFLLYLLHPCWNIRAICETDKQPINPIGFPVTVRPMMVYCCIYNGIYSLCLYDFAV